MTDEFNLIHQYFQQQKTKHDDVLVGSGDDGAIMTIPNGQYLVAVVDTMVEGIHFLPNTNPADLGHKILAVNLSDLAAMGAQPCWLTLTLTLPEANEPWIKAFSEGLFSLADQYHIELIGGDLTRGPLSMTCQAHGYTPYHDKMLRSNAKPGDLIYVTDALGDAGFGLQAAKDPITLTGEDRTYFLEKHNKPLPQIATGLALRNIANACMDISDGLLSDLGHILKESHVGAEIDVDKIPLSNQLKTYCNIEQCQRLALSAGDDYQLLFTASAANQKVIEEKLHCQHIGMINNTQQLSLRNCLVSSKELGGFNHFLE